MPPERLERVANARLVEALPGAAKLLQRWQ
jgi:hypothetical protein